MRVAATIKPFMMLNGAVDDVRRKIDGFQDLIGNDGMLFHFIKFLRRQPSCFP